MTDSEQSASMQPPPHDAGITWRQGDEGGWEYQGPDGQWHAYQPPSLRSSPQLPPQSPLPPPQGPPIGSTSGSFRDSS